MAPGLPAAGSPTTRSEASAGPATSVWDAYVAFGKSSRWRSGPSGVLASGSDIVDNTGGLEQRFVPLLGES